MRVGFFPHEKEQVQAILAKLYAAAELLICLQEMLHPGAGAWSNAGAICWEAGRIKTLSDTDLAD